MVDRDPACVTHEHEEDHEALVDVLSYVILGLAAVGLVTVFWWLLWLLPLAVKAVLFPIGKALEFVLATVWLALSVVKWLILLATSPIAIALAIVAVIVWSLRPR
jgi:hypothetical protein